MKEYCENPFCETRAVKEVPVSVDGPDDQVRALCATCEEVYTWGVQHGKESTRQNQFFVLAVANSGVVDHALLYHSKPDAEKGLVEYLRKYHDYDGPGYRRALYEWLGENSERISVNIVRQSLKH